MAYIDIKHGGFKKMFDVESAKTGTANMAIAAAGATYSAFSLEEWVAIATLLFVLLQIGLLMPKYYKALCKFFSFISSLFKKKKPRRK